MSQGKLIVISGASGVGKGTVLKLMMEQRAAGSCCCRETRGIRPDDTGRSFSWTGRRRSGRPQQ